MASLLDRLLPEPDFVVRDPEAVTQALVRQYEELTGLTLYPAQVERIMVDIISYRESLFREALQDAAKLNLVRYSRYPILDFLGENVDCSRLEAKFASCTLRFNLLTAPLVSTVLPAGTTVNVTGGGSGAPISFSTTAPFSVPAGTLMFDVLATCDTAGAVGNGFVAGQVNDLGDVVPGLDIDAVANTDASAGGAEAEDDDHYRERIVLAPEAFSNAGSQGAYRFYALSANSDIVDVGVVSPTPGYVHLYPLTITGLPTPAVLAQVLASCNADKVRPMTDFVQALAPTVVPYVIEAQLTLYTTADQPTALAQAIEAIKTYRDSKQASLGRDIVRSQMADVLHVYGVYKVDILQPAADVVIAKTEWPQCLDANITVTVVATAQG